jgi:hypothetical protein
MNLILQLEFQLFADVLVNLFDELKLILHCLVASVLMWPFLRCIVYIHHNCSLNCNYNFSVSLWQ